jgi:signal transduction histidine kinase
VNDILEASRMITGRARLNVQVLVFDRLLREAVEAIGPAARARSLRVSVSSPGGIEISADPDRLRQILWNLLSNAVKFTPPGGEIQVQVMPEDRELVLAVRDTGIGIPAAHLPLIFQRFWQAEPVQSRDHGGLGLGLALVRHFVELHGGTITATSAGKGSGATFQIRLPLQQHAPENGSSLIRQAGSTPG